MRKKTGPEIQTAMTIMAFLMILAAGCDLPPYDLALAETLAAGRNMKVEKEFAVELEDWMFDNFSQTEVYYNPDLPVSGFGGGYFLTDLSHSNLVDSYRYDELGGSFTFLYYLAYDKLLNPPEIAMVLQNSWSLSDGRSITFEKDTVTIYEGGVQSGSVFIGNLKFAYEILDPPERLVFTHVYLPKDHDRRTIITRVYTILTSDFR